MKEMMMSNTPFLDKYTENLTAKVSKNIDTFKVIGREAEIFKVFRGLLRSTKNSPILIGDAGVGKTAIVEGVAVKILKNEVPSLFIERYSKNVVVRNLQLSSLLGEEEGGLIVKFRKIIEELKAYKKENILFIDEIHTLMGAGREQGAMDAAQEFKPALARGEIQLIGATTLDEFHDYIEVDPAMERRFQRVMVEEPTEDQAIEILNGVAKKLELVHGIAIKKSAIKASVDLSLRFIPELYLPDKAIDLLDLAATSASMNDENFIHAGSIAEIIQDTKGIPVTTILRQESVRLDHLEENLKLRVMGQDEAIDEIVGDIKIARAGLQNLGRPMASFLFLGTTGVGKTELAKALAYEFFGDENAMIRLDMSEFSQEGDSKKLIGDKQNKGILTEKVRNKPYSIVLIDETEKGNRETHDLFLQILDDGRLTDARGRNISFKNTIVILTTNTGARVIKDHFELNGQDMNEREKEAFLQRVNLELERDFRPEFINRIGNKIVFNMLNKQAIREIAVKNLDILQKKLEEQGAVLNYDEKLLDYLVDNGSDKSHGARPIERFIKRKVTSRVAEVLLSQANKVFVIDVIVHGEKPGLTEAIDRRELEFKVSTMDI